MTTIVRQIEIKASLEKVFRYVVDGENAPEWHPSIKVAKRISGGIGKDSIMYYLAEVEGKKYEWVTEVIEYKNNQRYVDRQKRGPFKKYVHIGEFEKTDEGTRYIFTLEYELPYSILGKLVDKLKIKKRVIKDTEESLKNLKRILEEKT